MSTTQNPTPYAGAVGADTLQEVEEWLEHYTDDQATPHPTKDLDALIELLESFRFRFGTYHVEGGEEITANQLEDEHDAQISADEFGGPSSDLPEYGPEQPSGIIR